MMKFFRKYNKQMLAVLMALLLIVWLAGDALQYFLNPDRSNRVVATSVFGDITNQEWGTAAEQIRWMERIGLPWQYPLGQRQVTPLDQPAWVLLTREAHQMGIRSSRPVVENILTQMRINDAGVLRLGQQFNVKTEVIYDAATAFTDVLRYLGKMSQATTLNEAEVRRIAQDTLQKVQVKAVVLRADAFEDADATFSESEIQEQFDKYKDKKPTGSGTSFGYMLPPRVKVQYVKIEPVKLEEQIPETEKLVKEARSYWSKNKEDPAFKRPPEDATSQPASQPDEATSQPASQPNDATSKPASQPAFFTKWEEAKDAALKAVRKQTAAKEAQKFAESLILQSADPWLQAEDGPDQYKVAPKEVQTPSYYEDLLKQAPASQKGIHAASVVTTEMLSPENIGEVPGIGGAYVPNAGGVPLGFGQLAFRVQGLAEKPTGEDVSGVDLTTFLARHQTSRSALQDDDGNLYVFRVIEVDAERAPRELAEVRDKVIADLRTLRGLARAEAEAEKLRAKAATDGLAAAWESATELKEKIAQHNATEEGKEREAGLYDVGPFARRSFGSSELVKFVPKIGAVNEEFVKTCFTLGSAEGEGSKLKTVAMPESATVAVVEWVKDVPADQSTFTMMRGFISSQLQQDRQETYLASWIAPHQVRARNKFEFKSEG